METGKEKLLRLEFGKDEPEPALIKIVSQAMLEAALDDGMPLGSAQVVYVDVPRGALHKGGPPRRADAEEH